MKRKEKDVARKAEEAKKMEEVAKKEADVKRREADAKRKEKDAKKKEDAARHAEEVPPPPRPKNGDAPNNMTSTRSHTPGPSFRTPSTLPYAPAPSIPALPRLSTHAPTSMAHRVQTPAPLVPPRPRRLSPPPLRPKIMRSTSEEKAEPYEIWIPPVSQEGERDYYNQSSKLKSSRPS